MTRMMRYIEFRPALSPKLLSAAFAALLSAVGFGSLATAQSFDCKNARYADERAICQNSRLGDLDKQLADTYDRAGSKLSKQEREEFENHETAFVNARHRCGEHLSCIEQSYRNRLQELLGGFPGNVGGRPDRPDNTKRTDRQKVSREDAKTEAVQTGPEGTRRDAAETSAAPPERGPKHEEAKSAAPPPAAVPNPPSRREAEAALAGSPPAEKQSRHKRRSESVAVVPVAPEHEQPPVASATPVPERHAPKSSDSAASERHPQTESSMATPEPSNSPEKRHSRARHVASGASIPLLAPADQAEPAAKPERVNPAPSP